MTDTLGIKEVSEEAGMAYRALRFYEEKGLISPERSGTMRLYSPAALQRAKKIKRMLEYGFTVSEIKKLIDAPRDEYRKDMLERLGELEEEIQDLYKAKHRLSQELLQE